MTSGRSQMLATRNIGDQPLDRVRNVAVIQKSDCTSVEELTVRKSTAPLDWPHLEELTLMTWSSLQDRVAGLALMCWETVNTGNAVNNRARLEVG